MHIKILIALLGIIIGVVCAEMFLYASEIALVSVSLGVVQLILYFFEVHHSRKKTQQNLKRGFGKSNDEEVPRRISVPLMSGIFFMCVALGILRVQFTFEKNSFVCTTPCELRGTIIATPEVKGIYQVFTIRPENDEAKVYDVQVKTSPYPRFTAGQEISLFGKVLVPSLPMEHNGEKVFDYGSYLQLHNVGSEMLYPKIEILGEQNEEGLVSYLRSMKESFLSSIFLYVDEPSASLASGMLFGNSSMSKELVETFRVAGLSHIVVLSGFNIAVLISFVLLVLMFVPLFLRVFLAGTLVIFFVLMVGAEVSIVRATAMSFIALLALLIGRQYVARQALLISLLLIILYQPSHLLHDISLHLSFLATAGIVYMSDGIKKLFTRVSSSTYQEIFTTTLCAYIVTLPYLMYTFGTASLYALIANVVVLPFVPVMMLLTFLIVVLSPLFSPLGFLFGYITTTLGEGIIFVARVIEKLPFASINVSVSFGVMSFMYCCLVAAYLFFILKRKDETLSTKNDELFSDVISY